jgi:hypothetical protein
VYIEGSAGCPLNVVACGDLSLLGQVCSARWCGKQYPGALTTATRLQAWTDMHVMCASVE